MDLVARALRTPRCAERRVADWVDLQYSFLLPQVDRAALHARGRLLDVACGDKPYEAIFRPHVTEYVGIEHEGVCARDQRRRAACTI